MSDFTTITSFLNLLGLGGLAAFIVWTIKGLNQRIRALTELAKEQNKTMETVRSRAQEFEKLSKGYKQALLDFQEMGQKLEEKRGELVKELEVANERKDQELVRLKELQLEEITLKKQSLEKVSQLETSLKEAVGELQKQLQILAPSSSPSAGSGRARMLYLLTLGNLWRSFPGLAHREFHQLFAAILLHDMGHMQMSLFDLVEPEVEKRDSTENSAEEDMKEKDGQQEDQAQAIAA